MSEMKTYQIVDGVRGWVANAKRPLKLCQLHAVDKPGYSHPAALVLMYSDGFTIFATKSEAERAIKDRAQFAKDWGFPLWIKDEAHALPVHDKD